MFDAAAAPAPQPPASVHSRSMNPQPLLLEPILKAKVWGGRRLAKYHKPLPDDQLIGESWELADLANTAAEGGGGGAACSRIASGEARGIDLRAAVKAMGANLLGHAPLTDDGGFPLLVKYLDAQQNLSVQVHPSPAYAAANSDCHLKTETWVVLDTEPDSQIYSGLCDGVTQDRLLAGIEAGSLDSVMRSVPARVGDVHHLPSGTVHALGAGVLVAEVQSPSDTTFRLFDWGREGRQLHLEQALECIDFADTSPSEPVKSSERLVSTAQGVRRGVVESNDLYELAIVTLEGGVDHELPTPADVPSVLMFVAGEGRLAGEAPLPYRMGDTVLIPARLDGVPLHASRDTRIVMATLREG